VCIDFSILIGFTVTVIPVVVVVILVVVVKYAETAVK